MCFKRVSKIIIITLIIGINFIPTFSDTLILQQGLNQYQGCSDITIYNTAKCKNYSAMFTDEVNSTPTDADVVCALFRC